MERNDYRRGWQARKGSLPSGPVKIPQRCISSTLDLHEKFQRAQAHKMGPTAMVPFYLDRSPGVRTYSTRITVMRARLREGVGVSFATLLLSSSIEVSTQCYHY